MAQAFFGGVHPNDMKAATNEKAIEQLAAPAEVVIPMSMHIGAPCKPVVSVGDKVTVGQLIGEPRRFRIRTHSCQRFRHCKGRGAPSLLYGRHHDERGH